MEREKGEGYTTEVETSFSKSDLSWLEAPCRSEEKLNSRSAFILSWTREISRYHFAR